MNPWTMLMNALGSSLAFFYDLIPNYGMSIILLTVAVNLLLFPLTLKQTRSMKGMQEIQPEVKRLQKELKQDKEELNKQLMALYQEKGVNPAAGCLPMLVQMPIWFALYRVLWQGQGIPSTSSLGAVITDANAAIAAGIGVTDKAFDAVTFLGMNLLVSPSRAVDFENIVGSLPYLVMLVMIMATGYLQQVQTTRRSSQDTNSQQTPQAQGMQNAMKFMPVLFGFISWSLVSGLGIYFATANTFRVAQQWFILRMGDDDGDTKDDREGRSTPSDGPTGDTRSSGPSPHASKKRNRRRKK